MTIYDIKRATLETAPHFFDRATLRFFGQTMRSFSVKKLDDGRYIIGAPMRKDGKVIGHTVRYFNPSNNMLEHK